MDKRGGNGKGDLFRPLGVPLEVFDANFDAIFGKKVKDESSTRHRDEQATQPDMASSDTEHRD